jgi:membrane protein YdbS with pleckstrin-like domain
VKIPRRVNAAWDWLETHVRFIWAVAIVIIVVAAARWVPELAAFILGAAISGFLVRLRMAARVARLRAETDDLLRENGALRHEKTVLAGGVLARQSVLTQRLPMIPDLPDAE